MYNYLTIDMLDRVAGACDRAVESVLGAGLIGRHLV